MKVDLENLLTVTEASNRGVSRLVSDAEYGIDVVVTRNGKPAAGVVSIKKLKRLSEVERAEQSSRSPSLPSRASSPRARRTQCPSLPRMRNLVSTAVT